MIDTVIVSGGNIQDDFALDFLKKVTDRYGREKVCLTAADKGLEFFERTGLKPDMAVGDFESLSEKGQDYLESLTETEIIRLKPEKDDSDTQSAVCHAALKGAKEMVLLGCLGTRMDHMLANLGLLLMGEEMGVHISIVDGYNYISLVKSGTVLKKAEQWGEYVSFFALGGEVCGLTLEGFKYPLQNYHLAMRDSGLTVSNEIASEYARIIYESGNLVMIMSRDSC